MYVWLSSFQKRTYYKKMFVAIDNYFNYTGYLKSREVFEEFKGRELIEEEEGGKILVLLIQIRQIKPKNYLK